MWSGTIASNPIEIAAPVRIRGARPAKHATINNEPGRQAVTTETRMEGVEEFVRRVGDDAQVQTLIRKLNTYFEKNGRRDYEDCATEVMLRVSGKILTERQGGERIENIAAFCFGVAQFVLKERRREDSRFDQLPEQETDGLSRSATGSAARNAESDLLENEKRRIQEECFRELSRSEQELLVQYYVIMARGSREQMAAELGLTYSALSQRIFAIKKKLQECVRIRLENPHTLPDRRSRQG